MKNFTQKIKMGKGWIVCLCLILAGGLALPTSASASLADIAAFKDKTLDGIENAVIKTGLPDEKKKLWEEHGLLIKPFFRFAYDLTSNVFKAPDDHSDHTDNLWNFTPGFQFLKKGQYGVLGGAYEATFRYFSQFSQQNEVDQKFLIYTNIFPTEDTYIRASEKIDQQGATAGSSAFEPVNFLDNTVNVVAGYNINDDWTMELGYENYDRDFSATVARRYSYNEDKYDYRAYYKLRENMRFYSGARIAWVDFCKDPSRDTFYVEIPLGFEGKLPYGVDARASVGFHHRNLEDSDRNDLTHVVTNISLAKVFNHERTAVELGFLRRPVESSFSTATTYDEKMWYGSLKHLMTAKLRARINLYVGNRDFEERVFTGTRFVAGGRVFVSPPNQVKRNDEVFGFGFGFDYNVRKWLVLHLDYQYSRRDSNISALDYTENVLSLRSTIPL